MLRLGIVIAGRFWALNLRLENRTIHSQKERSTTCKLLHDFSQPHTLSQTAVYSATSSLSFYLGTFNGICSSVASQDRCFPELAPSLKSPLQHQHPPLSRPVELPLLTYEELDFQKSAAPFTNSSFFDIPISSRAQAQHAINASTTPRLTALPFRKE